MPKLDIEMFDDEPKLGDRIKVMGKVKSIDDDTGMVEVSYDDVSIVKKKRNDKRDDDDEDGVVAVEVMSNSDMSNSQSLDEALSKAFPQTQ